MNDVYKAHQTGAFGGERRLSILWIEEVRPIGRFFLVVLPSLPFGCLARRRCCQLSLCQRETFREALKHVPFALVAHTRDRSGVDNPQLT